MHMDRKPPLPCIGSFEELCWKERKIKMMSYAIKDEVEALLERMSSFTVKILNNRRIWRTF